MMTLPITGLYAAIFGLFLVGLSYRVIRMRMKYRVGLMDGGHIELTQAIRVHGNAIEWIPIFLILLACTESHHLAPLWLHAAGILFLIARSLHVYGITTTSGRSFGRLYGMVGTWSVIFALAAYNVFFFVKQI